MRSTHLVGLAVLVLATAATGQRGSGRLPGSLGVDFGDLIVRVLEAEDGVTRVALSSPTGVSGPLVRSRPGGPEVVLETLLLFGARGAGASISLDGGAAQRADWSGPFGASRFRFDQPLSFDSSGHAGAFEVHGPGFQSGAYPSWQLPPFTAIVSIGGVASGLRQFTGFETGDLGEFSKVVGGASVQSSTVRSGAFGLRSLANAGEYAYATLFDVKSSGFSSASLGIDELYLSFQFRVADWDQRVRFAEVGGESGATKCRVELEPDGRISLEDDGLTRRFGQQVLATDQWYRIDLIVGTGTSTRLQLMIDGQVEIDVNDANTSNELTRRVHIGRAASSGGQSDFYYDDVVLSDQSHAGDARVVLLAPDGPGAASQWVGGSSELDDWPHDGDASYAVSNGPGAITCALDPATGISGQVLGVKALAVQRSEDSSFAGSALRLRSAGLDFDSSSGDAGASYRLRSRVFEDDPATGSAWQLSALDELEVGLVQLPSPASLATRVTAVGVQVLYAPGSGGGGPSDVRQFSGFETGDLSEFRKALGGASVQSAVVRSGAFAMRSLANPGEYAYATLFDLAANGFGSTSFGIDDLYLSFQLRVDDWSQRIRFAEVSGEGGSTKLRVELESDGRVSVKDASSTRYYSQLVLATGQWYRIGLRVGTGSPSEVQLLIDGQLAIDVSDADTSSEPTRRVHLGRSSKSGGPSDFYFDDVIVSDQGLPADARVLLLEPDGDGAFSGWLGDCFDLDDWPHDGDATFAVSNGPGTITCGLDPATGVSGQILGVKALAVQRREGESFTSSALSLRSGGLDFDSAPGDGGPNWRLRSRLFAEDPATGSGWQLSALDNLEVGLRQLEAQPNLATRATAVGAAILYAP